MLSNLEIPSFEKDNLLGQILYNRHEHPKNGVI